MFFYEVFLWRFGIFRIMVTLPFSTAWHLINHFRPYTSLYNGLSFWWWYFWPPISPYICTCLLGPFHLLVFYGHFAVPLLPDSWITYIYIWPLLLVDPHWIQTWYNSLFIEFTLSLNVVKPNWHCPWSCGAYFCPACAHLSCCWVRKKRFFGAD